MATIKIHLMLGQGLLQNGSNTQAFLAESGDPDLIWAYPNPAQLALNTRVLVYDHANNRLGNANPAEPWFQSNLSNLFYNGAADPESGSWGHDLTFLREVARRETAEWHLLVKLVGNSVLRDPGAASGNIPHRFDKAGADLYPDIVPAITNAKALAEALPGGPHTVEIGSITTSFGYQEAANYALNAALANGLKADWEQFITDVRTDIGAVVGASAATAPSILYRIHSGTRITGGGSYLDLAVQVVQNAVSALATSVAKAVVLNVDRTDLRTGNIYMTAPATAEVGEIAAEAYFRIVDPPQFVGSSGAISLVCYVGQSNVVGQSPAETLTGFFNADPNLQPFDGAGNPKAWDDVWTMNHTSQVVEPFNPYVNSNTLPNGTWAPAGKFGPSVSMVGELRKILGEILLFQVGVGSASLGPNTKELPVFLKPYSSLVYGSGPLVGQPRGVWPTIEQSWKAMRASCLELLGKLPDPRLIVIHQGESDTEAALHPAYAGNLRTFLADLRALTSVDTKPGSVVPAGIVLTRKVPGGAFDVEGTDVVRAAQRTVAAEAGNFLVEADDMPYRTDKVHLTAEGSLRIGRRIVESLPASFNVACGAGG